MRELPVISALFSTGPHDRGDEMKEGEGGRRRVRGTRVIDAVRISYLARVTFTKCYARVHTHYSPFSRTDLSSRNA